MERDVAELSSISSQLAELTDRVVAVARDQARGRRDDVANDLYEVERSLRGAVRRLDRANRTLRG